MQRTGAEGFTAAGHIADSPTQPENTMQSHVKQAVITTAIVLVSIFILRKVPVVGPLVDTAING